MRIMLWALQSPINIGMILRTAEVYQIDVGIFDRYGILTDHDALATTSDFACGALQRRPPAIFAKPEETLAFCPARSVATAISGDVVPIQRFRFQRDDCFYVGNEYDGLPEPVLASAQARVTIPMPSAYLPKPPSARPIDPTRWSGARNDGSPNLNVAVASSILMFMSYAQGSFAEPVLDKPRGSRHGDDR